MKKIIFRADGNQKTGLGHLYRVLALFEMLKNDFKCELVTTRDSETSIFPEDLPWCLLPHNLKTEEEPLWFSDHFEQKKTWVVLDGYPFHSSYMKHLRDSGFKVAYIDDLVNQFYNADLIINHSLQVSPNNYTTLPTTQLALGSQYAILRPLFLKAAQESRQVKEVNSVVICFGGADPLNLTMYSAEAILKINSNLTVQVVLGAAYQHQAIYDLAKTQPQIKIHKNLTEHEMLGVMKNSQLAISSASTILYELFAVKMPVICGYYVENQKGIYAGSVANKLIFGIGNIEQFKTDDFVIAIQPILRNENFTDCLKNQSLLFDDKIKTRFIQLFSDITYRKAQPSDMMQVFEWSNDPITRANSYNSGAISLETHRQWFSKKLTDASSIIYIAEVNGQPAGMVRYEVLAAHSVVGVMIDPNYRGRGLASIFLQATANLFFQKYSVPILAYIKKTNAASVRSFENANYRLLKEEIVQTADSFVYELKTN